MTAPDLLVCPSCNRQKEEFWPDGFCGPDVCLNPDCNSQVAATAPAAMTPEVRALVEAAIDLASWVNNNVGGKPDYLMEHLEALDDALTALRAGDVA